jgi:hypothetical protein
MLKQASVQRLPDKGVQRRHTRMRKQASVQRRRAFMLRTGSAQSSSVSDLQEALALGSAQAEIGKHATTVTC